MATRKFIKYNLQQLETLSAELRLIDQITEYSLPDRSMSYNVGSTLVAVIKNTVGEITVHLEQNVLHSILVAERARIAVQIQTLETTLGITPD